MYDFSTIFKSTRPISTKAVKLDGMELIPSLIGISGFVFALLPDFGLRAYIFKPRTEGSG